MIGDENLFVYDSADKHLCHLVLNFSIAIIIGISYEGNLFRDYSWPNPTDEENKDGTPVFKCNISKPDHYYHEGE